ncbi:MAG: hypothetical protein QXU67_04315 [Candidatus Bathyarchaeia archaeon]
MIIKIKISPWEKELPVEEVYGRLLGTKAIRKGDELVVTLDDEEVAKFRQAMEKMTSILLIPSNAPSFIYGVRRLLISRRPFSAWQRKNRYMMWCLGQSLDTDTLHSVHVVEAALLPRAEWIYGAFGIHVRADGKLYADSESKDPALLVGHNNIYLQYIDNNDFYVLVCERSSKYTTEQYLLKLILATAYASKAHDLSFTAEITDRILSLIDRARAAEPDVTHILDAMRQTCIFVTFWGG